MPLSLHITFFIPRPTSSDDTRSEVVSSSDSTYPATSSDEVTVESDPVSALDENPEAFYTQYRAKPWTTSSSGRSSSPSSVDNRSAARKAKPLPPKLRIPHGPVKVWKRDGASDAKTFKAEIGATGPDVPTPSGPSPTPASSR